MVHGQRGARGVQGLHVDEREGARAVEADEDDVGPVVKVATVLRVPLVERSPVTVALAVASTCGCQPQGSPPSPCQGSRSSLRELEVEEEVELLILEVVLLSRCALLIV